MKLGLHIKHISNDNTMLDDLDIEVEYSTEELIAMNESFIPLINTLVAQLNAQEINHEIYS